jgi:ferritin-like metal-binding protein YciE
MMERLVQHFDAVEKISHGGIPPPEMRNHLRRHLQEAHALEIQSSNMTKKARENAKDALFSDVCDQHFQASRKHAKILEEQLNLLGVKPAKIDDSALGFGGWNWSFFFKLHSDTPVKLAGFAYAHEQLKAAGYELLARTAKTARDADLGEICANLVNEQRIMAEGVAATFDSVVQTTLAT